MVFLAQYLLLILIKIIQMKKLLLSIAILLPIFLFAQNGTVQFSEKYDSETGENSGHYTSWDIQPTGGFIYIVYSQDVAIREPLVLEVEYKKYADDDFTQLKVHNFLNDVTAKKKYAMYDLEFNKAGTFKVIVKTKNGKFLAQATTKINVVDDTKSSDDNTSEYNAQETINTMFGSNDKLTSDYYENSVIKFGTSVGDNATIYGEATEFKYKSGKTPVVISITNGKVFKCEEIKLSVYKKTKINGKEDTKLVQTIPVTGIGDDWDWVYATIDFTEKGDYIIDVWNENDVFINTGYVTIK